MSESKRKAEAAAKHLADCSDFVEALDQLIKLRLKREIGPPLYGSKDEEFEILKRQMKDWLRRNSSASGVYVEGDHGSKT